MRLYPPFTKTLIEIKDIIEFKEYLNKTVETNNTNHSARLRGKITDSGFKVEKKLHYYNAWRPKIVGKYGKANGKDSLTLHLELGNLIPISIAVFLFFIIVTGIIKKSLYAVPIILTVIIFFYIMGLIFYQIDLKKTKHEINHIIEKARTNKSENFF